jgi:hypothetical protein
MCIAAVDMMLICVGRGEQSSFHRRNRLEFITLLSGGAAMLPLPAPAQQPESMRRVGVVLVTTRLSDIYYAYCFDDGLDEYCYWHPASDVIITGTWIEYSPV